ncbi:MAG: exodeoxyribonuclease V subunit alpha [Colwellia sp.]|nr:exodeoxyribonuclease V subunit alpha [Colwellia sp.]
MTQIYTSFNHAQQQLADIAAIDYFFAREMLIALSNQTSLTSELLAIEQEKEQGQILNHLCMMLSVSLRAGHTCLPLAEISEQHWGKAYDEQGLCTHQGYVFPNSDILSSLLTKLDLGANAKQPLVFENNNLYMRRYYQFELELKQGITERLTERLAKPCLTSLKNISAVVEQLFPTMAMAENQQQTLDWQKIAVANAINKNFTVIAGGPGTGKTYTVTKLLVALLMLNEHALNIALVAPTGKAAQRLSESIIKAISGFKGLITDDVLAVMPTQATTIHRLLGVIPNSPNFRHNKDNLLKCDILLIDEVSMVDLPMMARIFRALKPEAKIILLGDADQLPSVAVGCVLADIAPRPHNGYSPANLRYLAQACQLDAKQLKNAFEQDKTAADTHHDHLSFLIKSHRFDGEGGIGKLAACVIQGQFAQSWQLLASSTNKALEQLNLVDNKLNTWLSSLVKQYYQGIAQCSDINQAFVILAKFRVLCVTRQGEFGVDVINQWIKEQLMPSYQHTQAIYHGMPIMISENDYRLGLFNGDIGLLWRTDDGHLMAFFEHTSVEQSPAQSYKILLPSRLPKYDSVYAMTIHKTQGSEFDHVAIVLPKQAGHQLLSRELLYTGITRAKTKLTIASNKQTWQQGVKTAIKRYSGLTL